MDAAEKLLSSIPPGGAGDYILDIGGESRITLLLHTRLGYGHLRGCTPGEAGQVDTREENGVRWQVDRFDLERDFYPYPSAHFRTIVCADVLDTLLQDPMHLLDEMHRVLRPGGSLVLVTRRGTEQQIRDLLLNCGMEIVSVQSDEDRCSAVGRKIGPLRQRYPAWLYPNR